ncbi:MAG: GDP-mannose 4,6-dehydratase [Phycisphaerae bacterium]|nr:GDP-mannose 4,6-dehydratase [Phycisphaerae bacterium]
MTARYTMITGGAGFIGTNLAARLCAAGKQVLIYDNLSRPGVERNVEWLRSRYPGSIQVMIADIRDIATLEEAVRNAEGIYHFAAQVAVTTSIEDPVDDFGVNLWGTFNLLEAIRGQATRPPLLFTSTNKVYGSLEDLSLNSGVKRYEPVRETVRSEGVAEDRPLEFHSPYGCSKGAADQYVLDYCRIYGLPAVVFRMSCIYGQHQLGTEDQGWVAHFLIQGMNNNPITIYGDGKQVRDILYVDDLMEAMLLATEKIAYTRGRAFNMGGGPGNTISILELLDQIKRLTGRVPPIMGGAWRQGDQRYYVSDTRKFKALTGWKPAVGTAQGIERLYDWLAESQRISVPQPDTRCERIAL